MESQHYPELPHEFPELDDIEERAERGRMFYQMFPGTAVSDEWLRHRHDMHLSNHVQPVNAGHAAEHHSRAKG